MRKSNRERWVVYFIHCNPPTGPIKIGTTGDLERRMSGFKCSLPYPFSLLKTLKGSYKRESELHKRFHKYRTQGEWFFPAPELLKFLGIYQNGSIQDT